MSEKQGNKALSEQSVVKEISIWRKVAGSIREDIRHRLGYPARLEHAITTGRLVPVPLNPPRIPSGCDQLFSGTHGWSIPSPDIRVLTHWITANQFMTDISVPMTCQFRKLSTLSVKKLFQTLHAI